MLQRGEGVNIGKKPKWQPKIPLYKEIEYKYN